MQAQYDNHTIRSLKSYVATYYPSLTGQITGCQYEQIAWIDFVRGTNQALLMPAQIPVTNMPFQTRRILARLYFLSLLRAEDRGAAHTQLIEGQIEDPLAYASFLALSEGIQRLSPAQYQQLWVACLTSVSDKAREKAGEGMPEDSVEFLAQAMSTKPAIYPAAEELIASDASACEGFTVIFTSGHMRHMLDMEGDPKMFDKLTTNRLTPEQLELWFAYWLVDITALSIHPAGGLGSENLRNNIALTLCVLKAELEAFRTNPNRNILRAYIVARARLLQLETFDISSQSTGPIRVRTAALLRIFSAGSASLEIANGLDILKNTMVPHDYTMMLDRLNPFTQRLWPTPTYVPVLLTNLYKKILADQQNRQTADSTQTIQAYQDTVVLGLPLIARALAVYDTLFDTQVIHEPLNVNLLAVPDNISRIIRGDGLDIAVNCQTGHASLVTAACTLSAPIGTSLRFLASCNKRAETHQLVFKKISDCSEACLNLAANWAENQWGYILEQWFSKKGQPYIGLEGRIRFMTQYKDYFYIGLYGNVDVPLPSVPVAMFALLPKEFDTALPYHPPAAELMYVYVDKPYRGLGFSRLIVQEARKQAEEMRMRYIQLDTLNPGLTRMYEEQGAKMLSENQLFGQLTDVLTIKI